MISFVERKCSWCRNPYPVDFHPLLCNTCHPKFYKSHPSLSIYHKGSSSGSSSRSNMQKLEEHLSQHKEVGLEIIDTAEQICCNGLLLGRSLGHQVLKIDKKFGEGQENKSDKENSEQITDEEFQEKKGGLCEELDSGFEVCEQRIQILENSLKSQMKDTEKEMGGSADNEERSFSLVMIGKEEAIFYCLGLLRNEIQRVSNHIKQWIDEIRNRSDKEVIKKVTILFNIADFIDVLHCVCHLANANKIKSHKIQKLREEEKQEEAGGDAREQKQKGDLLQQAVSGIPAPRYSDDEEEEIQELIASNFMISRKGQTAEFDLFKKRAKFHINLRLAKNWAVYNSDHLILILTSSMIKRAAVKRCLDYIFTKGYFTKVDIIVKVDQITEFTASKFCNILAGLYHLRTLHHLNIDITDTAQAFSTGNDLLAFLYGRLPKGITKKLILGSILMTISSDLASALPKIRNLESLDFSIKAFEIDNSQLGNFGSELSNVTKMKHFQLGLDSCNLITLSGITNFVESLTEQGSELTEVNLDIQSCDGVTETELDSLTV